MVFILVGKDFLGQVIKVEFAEKRVPKGGFGRGGGRGAVVFHLLHCQWIRYYATLHILVIALERPHLAKCSVVAGSILGSGEDCIKDAFFCLLGVSW